jgi:hypothetical protein
MGMKRVLVVLAGLVLAIAACAPPGGAPATTEPAAPADAASTETPAAESAAPTETTQQSVPDY